MPNQAKSSAFFLVATLLLIGVYFYSKRDQRTGEALQEAEAPPSQDILLLAGFSSNNIVAYDLATKTAKEILFFADGSGPRGIVQSPDGDLFVATRHGNKNVLRFGLVDGVLSVTDFTESIGRYGPTQLLMDDEKNVYVACDSTHEVRKYTNDGQLIRSYVHDSIKGNVGGFAIHGSDLFAAHIFRGAIAKFPLEGEESPAVYTLGPEVMKTTYSALWSHRNSLLVGAYRNNGKIVEIDPGDGSIVGTFVDLEREGLMGNKAMLFHEGRRRYFFAGQFELLEYDEKGMLIERHEIDIIQGVFGMCFARNQAFLDRMAASGGHLQMNEDR